MGGIGYYISTQAIFFFTAALAIPTLAAIAQIRPRDVDQAAASGSLGVGNPIGWLQAIPSLATNYAFMIFAGAIFLFQCANAATMPIMAGLLTIQTPQSAPLVLSVCIFGPQFAVAAIAPWVGRH